MEQGMWLSSAWWHAVANEKARSKERWLLIGEGNALWVKIKRHPLVIQWEALVSEKENEKRKSAGGERRVVAAGERQRKATGGERSEKPQFPQQPTIQGAMGRLPSKLCKNKNNTDISLYQIYLHENILKYYRLNCFSHDRQLCNLLKAFPTVSLFKLVNAAVIFAFSSSLESHTVLLVSCSTVPHI